MTNDYYQNAMTHTFNFTSTMVECHAYVDAVDDFKIEVSGKTLYTADETTQYGSSERAKVLLRQSLLEYNEAFAKSELELIKLLRSNRHHFEASQGYTIGRLNEQIATTRGNSRTSLEDKKERFLTFFHHNYTLIDLILARLTNSQLDKHLQFKLKQVGLDRMADGSQQLISMPRQSGVKLQWNGTNDSLYDLFAQLSLVDVKPGTPLLNNTIEGLAEFLFSHVEGMPSVETIERRIRAFREPQGQPPKRGRIELHINKETP